MKRCVVRAGASVLLIVLQACGELMVPPPVAPPPGTSPLAAPAASFQAAQEPRAMERANEILIVRPAGWQRSDTEDRKVVLTPPDLPPQRRAYVVVEPGDAVRGRLADHMTVAWRYVLWQNQAQLVQGGQLYPRPGAGFDALSSMGVMQNTMGQQTWAGLFLAAQGGRLEAIIFVADGADLWARYGASVEELIASARFDAGAAVPPAYAPPVQPMHPAPAPVPHPVDQGGLRVRQMYLSFAPRTGPGAEWLDSVRFDHLTLFTNGLTHQGPPPLQGPSALDLGNVVVRRNLGNYEIAGNEIRITWASGKTEILNGASRWQPLAKVDGLRLQGTYADPSVSQPTWITFAPDGTFRDQGVVRLVASLPYTEAGLQPPPGGAGTYALQDYALTLNYSYGSARMTFFILPEDDVQRPQRIVLNSRILGLHQ